MQLVEPLLSIPPLPHAVVYHPPVGVIIVPLPPGTQQVHVGNIAGSVQNVEILDLLVQDLHLLKPVHIGQGRARGAGCLHTRRAWVATGAGPRQTGLEFLHDTDY